MEKKKMSGRPKISSDRSLFSVYLTQEEHNFLEAEMERRNLWAKSEAFRQILREICAGQGQ